MQQSVLVRLERSQRRPLDFTGARRHSLCLGQFMHLPQRCAILHRHVWTSERRFGDGSEWSGALHARRCLSLVHLPDVSASRSGLGDETAWLHFCGYVADSVAVLQVWREDPGEESV